MLRRLTLVGYRACGKTTVGRLVATRLGWPFIDADAAISARLGAPIADFFARCGETAFREHEAETLAQILAADGPLVLASGGGAVISSGNRGLFRARGGLVVYLEASAALLQERLRQDHGERPSLTGGSVVDEVPRLLAAREGFYREVANAVIPADQTPEQAAEALSRLVENFTGTAQNQR